MTGPNCLALFLAVLVCVACEEDSAEVWRWTCENGKCLKVPNDDRSSEPALGLDACKMFCGDAGLLWPKPTGSVDLGNFLSKLNLDQITLEMEKEGRCNDLMSAAGKRFKEILRLVIPEGAEVKNTGKALTVKLINKNPDVRGFSLDMDESYSLQVGTVGEQVIANITGGSFFGLRHGLETLSQLIVYDEIRDHALIVRDVNIEDKPTYPYRGILLDTARNYFTISAIKRLIDGMAAVKLNTFHWHITDSHSFPFVSERQPNLSKNGAYTPSKVYRKEAILEVIQHGLVRGVRVLPEFDAPAHVGEGWQGTNLTVCFKAEPWQSYCVEPPCGQLNPTRDELYNVLEDIFKDIADVFQPDLFHMGGDEVSDKCWNSSQEIQDYMTSRGWGLNESSYLKLWDYFQKEAQTRAYKAFNKKLPLILWTSSLTKQDDVEKYLSKDDYIIQIWTTGSDPQIKSLLSKGYKLILSNYDALYMDCGYDAWVGTGQNWCAPYKGWKTIYGNSPALIADSYKDQILGAEAALWSEQVDSATLDGRMWPRAAAMAERLWAEPLTDWEDAEYRMLYMRERLVRMGIRAEALQPEWCVQNEGFCYA